MGQGHFRRYNAFFDHGWAGRLKPTEMAVWFAYERHASPDGESRPSLATVAGYLGQATVGHVKRARASLVRRGLIEIGRQGGGRGNEATVRVLVPPALGSETGADSAPVSASETVASPVPVSRANRRGIGAESGAESARKVARVSSELNKEEQPIEQPKEQTSNAPACAGVIAEPTAGRVVAPVAVTRSRRRPTVLTPEQHEVRQAFGDWWISAEYPRRHGGEVYEFDGGRDAAAVLKILRHQWVKWDLEQAKALSRAFFDLTPEYWHQLFRLGQNPGYFVRKMHQRKHDGTRFIFDNRRRDAAAGRDAEPIELPDALAGG